MSTDHFPADSPTRATSLVPLFGHHRSPQIVSAVLVTVLVIRITQGSWNLVDLAIVAVLVGVQPFTEWFIHVLVLHARPRQFGRLHLDSDLARKHRAHHRDPSDVGLIFIPWSGLVGGAVIGVPIIMLVLQTNPQRLTAAAVALGLTLHYEWVHFLVHTPYRPRTRPYRAAWRAHRLHHFRNEHYWFGVTTHLADQVLRTYPAKADVPRSPTARALHESAPAG